jgi:hypothetical protein
MIRCTAPQSDLTVGALAFAVDCEVGGEEQHREDHPWQPASAIYGHPDIPSFLLLDDAVTSCFFPWIGLRSHRLANS